MSTRLISLTPTSSSGGVTVEVNDSANLDAFGRLRTAEPGQRLDVEFIYNKQPDFFDEVTNNGTVTFNANTRDLTLSLSDANNGTHATMASHPVPYTPSNSQLIDITGVLDLAALGGGNAEVFLRENLTGSPAEQVIEQVDWDEKATGVDWTKSHIFSMDFQSLKVGRIRYNMVADGEAVKVTEINNDNIRDSGFWQSPSLPAYWKLYNDATYTYMEIGYGNDDNAIGFRYKVLANASATMKAICCSVKSEGGESLKDLPGLPRGIDNGTTVVTVAGTLIPILSIRPKTSFLTYDNLTLALPKEFTISTDNPVRVAILHNCTLTGASWTDVDASESALEYDVSASVVTGGHLVTSDYADSIKKNQSTSSQGLLGKTVLWDRQSSETGILTIAAIKTAVSNADVLAAIDWEEIR